MYEGLDGSIEKKLYVWNEHARNGTPSSAYAAAAFVDACTVGLSDQCW